MKLVYNFPTLVLFEGMYFLLGKEFFSRHQTASPYDIYYEEPRQKQLDHVFWQGNGTVECSDD